MWGHVCEVVSGRAAGMEWRVGMEGQCKESKASGG